MKRLIAFLLLLAVGVTASARDIYQLNDGWEFFFKSENTSDNARIVTLPHSWNTDPLAGQDFRETTGNYLREVYIPEEWSSKRIFIKFFLVILLHPRGVSSSFNPTDLGVFQHFLSFLRMFL